MEIMWQATSSSPTAPTPPWCARDVDAVQAFFGFDVAAWPAQTVSFDLGGRVLQVFGSPGHHKAAITCYDPWTAILFTGDTVLPGRFYVSDCPAFLATLDRMVDFCDAHPVSHVFGCHVEMTNRPARDYPIGATYQPDERVPQMTVAQLTAARDAARSVASVRGIHRFDDFIIYNEPRATDLLLKLMAGGSSATRSEPSSSRRSPPPPPAWALSGREALGEPVAGRHPRDLETLDVRVEMSTGQRSGTSSARGPSRTRPTPVG